ncbi:MAG: MFS transporter, partial [Candidatus Nanopelagicaceae bacterium]|nr:MFS transporter [Candidatus Nanopelagicaceae bacterium]
MPNHQQLQRKTLKTLTAAQIGAGVGTAGTVAAGSLLVASITGSEELAGLAQTFSVLGAAALAIPLARLTSSGGRRRALSVGYAAGVVGSIFAILGGVNSNIYLMLTGSFLVGSASASAYQARFAAIDLVEEAHRAKQLSYVVWGSTVGAVTGPNLMSPAGDFAEKLNLPRLTGPYLISAFTLTFAALLIYMFLKPDPYLTALGEGKSYAAGKKHVKEALSHIWHKPIALFAILAIAIGHVAMVSVMVMTPVHMAHVDVSLRIIGLVISVHVIGMYAFSPIVGSFSDRVGKVKTIQIGLGILLLSCLVSGTAAADDVSRLGMGLFLLGLGWSFTLIAGSALLSSSVDSTLKTSSQGASDLVMNLAGAGGGAIAGVVISSLNYGWLCAFASIPVITLALWSASFRSF